MLNDIVIVLAEDDLGHASLIKRNLIRSGIENDILHFEDGEKVLEYFFEKKSYETYYKGIPHILFLDLNLPKVKGLDILKKIKTEEDTKHIPVIVITTSSNEEEINLCNQYGCSNYIIKPTDYEKFVEIIKSLANLIKFMELPD